MLREEIETHLENTAKMVGMKKGSKEEMAFKLTLRTELQGLRKDCRS